MKGPVQATTRTGAGAQNPAPFCAGAGDTRLPFAWLAPLLRLVIGTDMRFPVAAASGRAVPLVQLGRFLMTRLVVVNRPVGTRFLCIVGGLILRHHPLLFANGQMPGSSYIESP